MSVVSSNEKAGTGRRVLTVAVPPAAVAAETDRVTLEYRKRARISGFRKGKVPLELVRKRFHDEIEQEVVERLVPRYWKQAQAEAELEPLLPPEVSDVDFTPGETLTFQATVDLRPEIRLGDLSGFELPEMETRPEEAEVDRAIDDLRRQVGEWREVDRPAARGDRVEGALTELTAGEAPGEPSEVAFEVGDETVWEELSLAVTGAKKGATPRFERREEGPEGPVERSFRIEVQAVRELELPPLDEETVKKIGDFESVEQFRERVTEELERRKQAESRRRREGALLEQLCERHPLELPEKVVENETQGMLREYAEELARRGVDVESAQVDWPRLAAELEPQARRRVQTRLLLDAVAESRELTVSEAEFEGQMALLARAQGTDPATLRRALDRDGRLDELRRRFLRGKAVDYLLGDGPPEPPAAEPADDAGEEE
ncbi:MAG: trigger factor [Thermoanaerobaculia bacterium]|nr:trigger factor [Thermoanaerobaculia bacterium]